MKHENTLTMARCLLLACSAFLLGGATAQAPSVLWHYMAGGSNEDYGEACIASPGGGGVIAGLTKSTDGDAAGSHGGLTDFFVVSLDGEGFMEWPGVYGGSSAEDAYGISRGFDGELVLVGATSSDDGDVMGPGRGSADMWVPVLGVDGELLDQYRLGSSLLDVGLAAERDPAGRMLVLGSTTQADGDVTVNHGSGDFWLARLEPGGGILWQQAYGGSSSDNPWTMVPAGAGGHLLVGVTASVDGDVTGAHVGSSEYVTDGWAVRVDSLGSLLWQRALGGSHDDGLMDAVPTADGGFALAGYTESNDGDVSGNHGLADAWAVKLDSAGGLVWQHAYGGSGNDGFAGIVATADGGFIAAGYSTSVDGDISGPIGGVDGWVVKLDGMGNLQWDLSLGGSGTDNLRSICRTDDGGFLLAGYSDSNDGDAAGNHGNKDLWAVKLGPEPAAVQERPAGPPFTLAPNPARESIRVRGMLQAAGPLRVEVYSSTGQLVDVPLAMRAAPGAFSKELDLSALAPGAYRLRVVTAEGSRTRSFVKMP